ncbi:MAG: aminomethyl-transferring glycine dehydrogenase subunit GcvPA [Deltaproteobacteria bacterium]|nr:aminomethyl-transferring glycine dehydrogenase subunit GcvPA [Deltaproteobacteria bacterium]
MRYIPHTSKDVEAMLKVIGVASVQDLFTPIPKEFRLKKPLNLPSSLSEIELKTHVESIANKNTAHQYQSFLGAGCYRHFVPTIVNYLGSQGGFLTAYTPYQPEISQGTLQAIFEFQTMIANLTGMEVANASMYDGASALAEACLMAKRLYPQKTKILVPQNIHPEYRDVCKTYLEAQEVKLESLAYHPKAGTIDPSDLERKMDADSLAVLVQTPNFFGCIEDLETIQKICVIHKALLIVAVPEPLSLALLKPPGESGADIVVGEAQSFGNAPSFGGPHVGFFASRLSFVRSMPGRIVGETTDSDGKRAFTLTLSTREQHIRREKATSNICTNQALLATRSTIYLSTLGEKGLKKLAHWNHSLANTLCEKLKTTARGKAKVRFDTPFFNEVVIETQKPLSEVEKRLKDQKILGGLSLEAHYPELKNCLLVCTTELNTEENIEALCNAL